MTIDNAKKFLQDIKWAKQRAINIQQDIKAAEESIGTLKSASNYIGGKIQSQQTERIVEQTVIRLDTKREQLAAALDEIFAYEDRLSFAITQLEPVEQDIIIGYYMRQKVHWQLAQELGYSDRNIKYLKSKAIKKLADKL